MNVILKEQRTSMKKLRTGIWCLVLILFSVSILRGEEVEKLSLSLLPVFHSVNDQLPFVRVDAKVRIERRWQPVPGVEISLYIEDVDDENFIGKSTTDYLGRSSIVLTPSIKTMWDSRDEHIFIAVFDGDDKYDPAEEYLEMARARILIDTLSDDGEDRQVVVQVQRMVDGEWINVDEELDLRIGVKRLGGFLSVGSDAYYYTDEEGFVIADFEQVDLPGDEKGILTLVVQLEDHGLYGTLFAELDVPWGVPVIAESSARQMRSLWGPRDRAPLWLLVTANAILLSVWGVLIYLVFQLVRIIRLGTSMKN